MPGGDQVDGLVQEQLPPGAVLRRVSVEERWLGEIFPDAYTRYRRDVPALIPFLRGRIANEQ